MGDLTGPSWVESALGRVEVLRSNALYRTLNLRWDGIVEVTVTVGMS